MYIYIYIHIYARAGAQLATYIKNNKHAITYVYV